MLPTVKSFTLGLFLFGLPHIASAEDAQLSKQYASCMEKAGGITANMLDCIAAETKRQDARLNQAYKNVMARLSPKRKTQLQEAQRAWIRYRDANCGFYADPDGGSIATVNSNDCFMSATASRAKELEGF